MEASVNDIFCRREYEQFDSFFMKEITYVIEIVIIVTNPNELDWHFVKRKVI